MGVAIIALVAVSIIVQATSEEDIVFPVRELGNCKSEQECESYCDKPENIVVCVNFAQKHNLMSEEEAEKALKFAATGGKGPGGCTSEESCESYCNDVNNINECIAFAEENDLLPPEELKEAKQVQAALAKGATLPGGCRNKNECDAYCENPNNMEVCLAFAEAAGFIPEEKLAEAKQALAAIKKGVKPPPCRGKKECDTYCAEPNNFEQCITFAEAAGFVSAEEAAMARKTGGKGPGNCKSKEECDKFCDDENNFQVCLTFAEEHGFMSKEEAEMARKTGGKGPGGCKSKESCEAFCQDPTNQETCVNFAMEHGLMSQEDLTRMEEGKTKIQELFSQATPEVISCLNSKLGEEQVAKLRAGTAMPSESLGDVFRTCFEGVMMQQGQQMMGGPSDGTRQQGQMDLSNVPAPILECLRSAVGNEVLSGQAPPPSNIEEITQNCVQAGEQQMMQERQMIEQQRMEQQQMMEQQQQQQIQQEQTQQEQIQQQEPQSRLNPPSLFGFLLKLLANFLGLTK